jgi:two-component system sensor histidine kinase HydH
MSESLAARAPVVGASELVPFLLRSRVLPREPQSEMSSPAHAAELEGVAERTGGDELRHRTLMRVFQQLLGMRRAVAPLLLGVALWIGLSDTQTWRVAISFLVVAFLSLIVVQDVHLAWSKRRGRTQLPALLPSLYMIAIFQHGLILVTGGMSSPLLPLILPIAFLIGLLDTKRSSKTLIVFQLAALWCEAGIDLAGFVELTPEFLAGSGTRSPTLTLCLAIVMSGAVIVTSVLSMTAAGALSQMIDEALASRDAALASRTEQTRALTTLSGEIAHELKNPLASVKGLAALIERGELSGKSAERMQVLRREVDRMQEILEELLNFSRPLVPLDLRELELRELVDHVVDLHEGVAADRRVSLIADGHARLRCDPRKVEQVLINLVQNAIEVAPAGSVIELDLRAVSSPSLGVELVVRDAGPGLPDALRGRVFEAGVTDKSAGSGLGLTIARALARQHGGELELGDRRDGKRGCEAILTLPHVNSDNSNLETAHA